MFNPLYVRTYLNEKNVVHLEGRIIYKHVVILPDGREFLIDKYNPDQGGVGWLRYPFKKKSFNTISELLEI